MLLQRLIKAFNAKNTTDLFVIFLVFGLAGSSTAYIADLVKPYFGITPQTPFWLKAIFFVVATLPIYQVILLAWGLIFFKFKYFLEFEKRMFSRWFKKSIKINNVQERSH